ncbi:MAG: FecR family protein [Bacteroidales bacterium]
MKSTNNIDELLAKHFANESLTTAQEVELNEWIDNNRAEFDQISYLYNQPLRNDSALIFDAVHAWKVVEPKLNFQRNRFKLRGLSIGIAASIILLIGVTLFRIYSNQTQIMDFTNSSLLISEVTLPDQSEVTLYPEASIHYESKKREGNRIVNLTGKAFFKVRKSEGRPFIVDAYNTQIKVLGTSFLVNAIANDETNVKVRTGIVSVENDGRDIILKANEQVDVTPDSMAKSKIHYPDIVFNTKPTVLKFRNTNMQEIIQQLESVFDIRIDIDTSLLNQSVTTTVCTDNIDDILSELSYLTKSRYQKVSDKKYRLYAE